MPVDDQGRPVAPVKVEVKCEKCGGPMGIKRGKRGAFLGCLNYPKCRSTQPIPDELKDQVVESGGGPPSSVREELKAIQVEETCENCGGSMVVREGRRGYFLGCANYPKCKGTREPGEVTLEKISAVTGR
jgi:DNA topoisomerase-1